MMINAPQQIPIMPPNALQFQPNPMMFNRMNPPKNPYQFFRDNLLDPRG